PLCGKGSRARSRALSARGAAEAREPTPDSPLPRRDVALAVAHGRPPDAALGAAEYTRRPALLGAGCRAGIRASDSSAAQGGLAVHSPLRRVVARFRRPVLGRAADGPRLHGRLRAAVPPPSWLGRPLVAARADVGGGAGLPKRPGFLRVAEHGADMRIDLAPFGGK